MTRTYHQIYASCTHFKYIPHITYRKMENIQVKRKPGRPRIPLTEEVIQHRKEREAIAHEKRLAYYREYVMPFRDATKRSLCTCGEMVLDKHRVRHMRSNKCIKKCRQTNQLESGDNNKYS